MKYLLSAFSLQMVPEGANLEISKISLAEAKAILFRFNASHSSYSGMTHEYTSSASSYIFEAVPAIGHEGTAKALSALLGINIPVERKAIALRSGDVAVVAQPTGGRIAYGEELDLPELSFFTVEFHTCYQPPWEQVVDGVDVRSLLSYLAEKGLRVKKSTPESYTIGIGDEVLEWYLSKARFE